jgi:hypothetical protein
MSVYYYKGAYRGCTEKFGKRITPIFNRELDAQHYKNANKWFSLSLSDSLVTTDERTENEILVSEIKEIAGKHDLKIKWEKLKTANIDTLEGIKKSLEIIITNK